MLNSHLPFKPTRSLVPLTIILGLNEIASAVAVAMHGAGFGVIMSDDPNPPVIRRGMAYFDALYGDEVSISAVSAASASDTLSAAALARERTRVVVTRLTLNDLLTIGAIDTLIDARMQKYTVTPDLRHLAGAAVGLGPRFTVGENCDVAIETKPGHEGVTLTRGETLRADGVSRQLGDIGRERFIYSEHAGQWRTALDVGARVFKNFSLGLLDGQSILAPFDGILRGIARDGIQVRGNVKLVEIDPRGRKAQWTGIDERGAAIAAATCRAVIELRRERSEAKMHATLLRAND